MSSLCRESSGQRWCARRKVSAAIVGASSGALLGAVLGALSHGMLGAVLGGVVVAAVGLACGYGNQAIHGSCR